MSKLLFVLLVSTSFLTSVTSQVTMTFTAGVSPEQTPASHYIFVNRSAPREEFTFDLAQIKAAYFVGVGAKYDLKPFFFTAEAQYNKREYVYDVSYTFPAFGRTEQVIKYSESMNVINMPLSLGVDLGLVDVSSGFLPQLIVSQDSDLEDLNGYSQKLKKLRFGWHTGLAVNINQLRVGVNWQMDFNNYVDHGYVKGKSLALQGRPTRLLGTLSYQF